MCDMLEDLNESFDDYDNASQNWLANKFAKECKEVKDKYIFDALNSTWYEYNNNNILLELGKNYPLSLSEYISKFYNEDIKLIYELSKQYNHERKIDEKKHKKHISIYKVNIKQLGNNKYKEGIINELKFHYQNNDIINNCNNSHGLISFKDKLFDFKIKKWRDIEKKDFILSYCPYNAPDDNNKDEVILKELQDIIFTIFEDKNIIEFFLDSLGFSLFTNEFEKLHLWSGTGGNGKGLIMSLINNAFSNYFYVPDNQFLTTKYKSSQANSSLYNTQNKKIVMVSEPENDNNGDIVFNLEFVKKLTGRDDITTREMYKTNVTFKPEFTCFVQCNEKPKLDKVEQAVKRRFICLNFPFQFVDNPKKNTNERKINYTLKDKLNNEKYYSQFMGLLINHIKDKKIELKIPQIILSDTNEYFVENNVIGDFLDAKVEHSPNSKDILTISELYKVFQLEYEDDAKMFTKQKFKQNLINNGFKEGRTQNKRGIKNLKFKSEYSDGNESDENDLDKL